jgi:hypothetical protein
MGRLYKSITGILSRDPEKSLDTQVLKGLVTKMYRGAKKRTKKIG